MGGSLVNRPPSPARSVSSALLAIASVLAATASSRSVSTTRVSSGSSNHPLRVWIVIPPRLRYLLGREAPLHPAAAQQRHRCFRSPSGDREDRCCGCSHKATRQKAEVLRCFELAIPNGPSPTSIRSPWSLCRRKVMVRGEYKANGFVRSAGHRVKFSVGPGISSPRRSIRPPAMGPSHSRSRPEEVGFAHA